MSAEIIAFPSAPKPARAPLSEPYSDRDFALDRARAAADLIEARDYDGAAERLASLARSELRLRASLRRRGGGMGEGEMGGGGERLEAGHCHKNDAVIVVAAGG